MNTEALFPSYTILGINKNELPKMQNMKCYNLYCLVYASPYFLDPLKKAP
jgi:hypothetical protein